MKLITCKYKDSEIIAKLSADEKEVYPLLAYGIEAKTMNELIDCFSLSELISLTAETPSQSLPIDEITLLAPIPVPKQDIICLGINYLEHAKESAKYKNEKFEENRQYPVYFSKRVNCALPHMGKLKKQVTSRLDYEAELALIIGKDCQNVKAANACEHIFGYTIINDLSARDIQNRHKQWYMGKSMTGFCPMGPIVVTADEISLDSPLKISSYVNGELRQSSNTSLMMFKPSYIIEELSSYTTLKAGTIISTGTPSGVGMGFDPPKFLNCGDRVDCEIEKIGRLTTFII